MGGGGAAQELLGRESIELTLPVIASPWPVA